MSVSRSTYPPRVPCPLKHQKSRSHRNATSPVSMEATQIPCPWKRHKSRVHGNATSPVSMETPQVPSPQSPLECASVQAEREMDSASLVQRLRSGPLTQGFWPVGPCRRDSATPPPPPLPVCGGACPAPVSQPSPRPSHSARSAVQSLKAVSAYFTRQQIPPFCFAEQSALAGRACLSLRQARSTNQHPGH